MEYFTKTAPKLGTGAAAGKSLEQPAKRKLMKMMPARIETTQLLSTAAKSDVLDGVAVEFILTFVSSPT
jgi:hypothetical protein